MESKVSQGNPVSRYKPLQGRGALSVTQSPWSGALGAGAAKVTMGKGRAALSLFGNLMRAIPSVAPLLFLGGDSAKGRPGTVGYNQERQGKAKQSIDKYNTMDSDGTVRNRLKVGPGKVGTAEESFDKAFASARSAGSCPIYVAWQPLYHGVRMTPQERLLHCKSWHLLKGCLLQRLDKLLKCLKASIKTQLEFILKMV